MSEANLSALFWKGFRVDSFEVKASDQLHIRLVPDPAVVPSAVAAITARTWSMTFTADEFESATSPTTASGWTCRFGACAVRSAARGGSRSTGWPGDGT